MTKIEIAAILTANDSAVKAAKAELAAAEARREAAAAAGGACGLWRLFAEGDREATAADLELDAAAEAVWAAKGKLAEAVAVVDRRVYGRGY